MNKFLNYITIALIAVSLFSCKKKNEWTPEFEKEYKEGLKEGMMRQGKGILSDEQVDYISECTVEKMKTKGINPLDSKKPGIVIMIKQLGKECSIEWMSKNNSSSATRKRETSWNPKNEETYKVILKQFFIKNGVKSDAATYIADCAITKFKEKNISPADLEKPENGDLVQKIGTICGQEWTKKK
ncbi:hypothetical protein OD917_13345 [Flavobacterium sp. SH_e]|uniref:Lipoprotein n=1 Tax=Flavobacterium anhuiense TaxID=459526 RepID=A0A444W381_9FLAO|nr:MULTISPECIES: hypothetical protein [Flavobacterium]MCV2485916.1 hypothetical protein [Flavobacterium sp. SH_e]RYJ40152.1 hypothetical protein NU08_0908 [Flavobacterium anhuiense]